MNFVRFSTDLEWFSLRLSSIVVWIHVGPKSLTSQFTPTYTVASYQPTSHHYTVALSSREHGRSFIIIVNYNRQRPGMSITKVRTHLLCFHRTASDTFSCCLLTLQTDTFLDIIFLNFPILNSLLLFFYSIIFIISILSCFDSQWLADSLATRRSSPCPLLLSAQLIIPVLRDVPYPWQRLVTTLLDDF